MGGAILFAALLGMALAGSDAALAQNIAAPAGQAPLPPARSSPGPIAAVQQQLQQQGYMPGPVNGVMTEKTRRAIAAYERRMGRPPDALAGSDPVRRVQAGLRRLGLFAGPVNGVVGPQTRDAIIRFEAARRLAIDPRVSDRLLAELDQAGATTAATPPAAAAPAAPAAAAPAAPATAAETTSPEALGRRKLPAGVNPPPIR